MFPRHDDFAVRTLGLPGMIGALGACFGRVVTLDSPRARPPGEFNWGVTLWHELAHVITLQLSDQRVPRWLTEGISVYEEKRARPEWGREMDIPVRAGDRSRAGDAAARPNSGFTNPETISLAYFQASLVVEHIVEVYGEPKLRALVQSYGDGLDTEAALTQGARRRDRRAADVVRRVRRAAATARCARRWRRPRACQPELPLDALQAIARRIPAASRRRWRSAWRCTRRQRPTRRWRRSSARRRWCRMRPARTARRRRSRSSRWRRATRPARPRRSTSLTAYDHTDVASARKLATLLDGTQRCRPALQAALKRAVAVDPFDAPRTRALGRMALAGRQTRRGGHACSAWRSPRARRHGRRARRPRRGAGTGRAQRDEAKRQALAALEIAPDLSRARRTCC